MDRSVSSIEGVGRGSGDGDGEDDECTGRMWRDGGSCVCFSVHRSVFCVYLISPTRRARRSAGANVNLERSRARRRRGKVYFLYSRVRKSPVRAEA